MKENILLEVKSLHVCIGKYLFELGKKKNQSRQPSPLQMRIIEYLIKSKETDIYQKDIQESLDVSKAAISDTLKTMEKKNLIERIPSKQDGRKIKIVITKDGLDSYQEVENDLKKVNQKILENIKEEELEEFIRISHKIKESLKKEGKE